MSKEYPPIPGVVGKRGRPSKEEMEARRVYWEAQGGVPEGYVREKPTAKPLTEERAGEILTQLVEAAKNPPLPAQAYRARPKTNTSPASSEKLDSPVVVEEMVQEIVKTPVNLSFEEIDLARKILEKLPPKRAGRPTREAMEAKSMVERKIKELVATKIQMDQKNIPASAAADQLKKIVMDDKPVVKAKAEKPVAPVLPPGQFPQYKYGDAVRLVTPGQQDRKGIVFRHDIGSRWVYISWKDGSKDWRGVETLNGFRPSSLEEAEELTSESAVESTPPADEEVSVGEEAATAA